MKPGKPRPRPPGGEDLTDLTAVPASWADVAVAGEGDSRATQETAALPAAPGVAYELAPGARLGEYEIERKIGEGGMGVVFSAIHPLIGKRAAIKILKQELCADPVSLDRFIDEARVVNQIGHPNIVDVFAFGEMPDGRSYFVMEWLQGETLRERIARGSLTLDEIAEIVRPLTRALQAAHGKGVIHRDLKPDNVYLVELSDEQRGVKLLDFGIAKLASNDHRVERTATGAIIGTPQYIAPEQAKGYAIDHRADIYALGSIVFEMLTGRPPFIADNAMEMVAKHLMEPPVPASTLAAGVPPELDALVLRMLAKSPDGRPSLAEIRAVFERTRGRAPTPLAHELRAASAPALTPSSMSGYPPVAARTWEPSAPVAVPGDGAAVAVSQQASIVQPRRRWTRWLALAGVPVAGAIAFVIVDSLGDATPEGARASSAQASAVSQELPPEPTVIEPVGTPAVAVDAAPAVAVDTPPVVVDALPAVVDAPPEVTPRDTTGGPGPRPVVKPARGRLQLTISGAQGNPEVLVDGAPSSPSSQLAVGRHTVEVRSPGAQPQRFVVVIRANATTTRAVSLVPVVRPQDRPRPVPEDDGDKLLIKPGTLPKR